MRIADFALERYFARWEFAVRHVLCASDVEGWSMAELVGLMDGETRALWDDLRLGYAETTGHPLLRREIAGLYETIEPDDVLVFAGAEEAIFCLLNVLVGPGDHVLVTWPGYQSLYEVARAAGATVGLHALREEDGWALDVDRLRRSIHPNTKAVIVNAPHNPTGMLPSREEWAELAAACDEAGVVLIADEVYRFLEYDEPDRLPIGWLASRDRALLERCAAFKDYTTICSAAPSEILAIAGLRARETVLERSRALVAENLERIDRLFAERADTFAWVRPRAGSVGFPRLLRGGPIDRFAEELVETEGVLLLPASTFGFGGDHFRIGLGRTDIPEALARLDAFLDRRG
jgi:aspartate/methionine/tyrosine aminotransferase